MFLYCKRVGRGSISNYLCGEILVYAIILNNCFSYRSAIAVFDWIGAVGLVLDIIALAEKLGHSDEPTNAHMRSWEYCGIHGCQCALPKVCAGSDDCRCGRTKVCVNDDTCTCNRKKACSKLSCDCHRPKVLLQGEPIRVRHYDFCAVPNCNCDLPKICTLDSKECNCSRPKYCIDMNCKCSRPKACPNPYCTCSYPKVAVKK